MALLLASLAAYGTVGAALRPVDAMRRRAAEISAAEADQRLPLPPRLRRASPAGRDPESNARSAPGGRGARASVRRRRQSRAAHPAGPAQDGARAGAAVRGEPEELRAAIASAIEEADRLSQLAEDLLVLARSDKGRLSIEPEPVEVARRVRRGSEPSRRPRPGGRSIARRRRSRRPGRRGRSCRVSSRHSPTWSRTGCATGTVRSACGPARGTMGSSFMSATPARASRRSSFRMPSSASGAPTPPGRRAEPGLALRSSTRSPRPTAVRRRRETRPMAARTSGLSWVGRVDRLVCAQPGDESIFARASSSESATGNARSSSNSDRVSRSGCSRVT